MKTNPVTDQNFSKSWSDISEKLEIMLYKQDALNMATFTKHGTSYQKILKDIFFAILDEIGEWNHERKGDWCWWKDTQKPVNRGRELEEFVDILHFTMTRDLIPWEGRSWEILPFEIEGEVLMQTEIKPMSIQKNISWLLNSASEIPDVNKPTLTARLLSIGKLKGYSFDEIYQTYMKKNSENFRRLQEGY